MKKYIAFAALMLPLALAGCSHPHPVYDEPPPPPDYAEVARQGFHDGFAAAHRDVDQGNHRTWSGIRDSAILRCLRRLSKTIGEVSARATRDFCIAVRANDRAFYLVVEGADRFCGVDLEIFYVTNVGSVTGGNARFEEAVATEDQRDFSTPQNCPNAGNSVALETTGAGFGR